MKMSFTLSLCLHSEINTSSENYIYARSILQFERVGKCLHACYKTSKQITLICGKTNVFNIL